MASPMYDQDEIIGAPRLLDCVGAQSMGGNGLIVSFGKVMPMRLGRLQRQSRRAFWAREVVPVV
jgi:hypothetical protein